MPRSRRTAKQDTTDEEESSNQRDTSLPRKSQKKAHADAKEHDGGQKPAHEPHEAQREQRNIPSRQVQTNEIQGPHEPDAIEQLIAQMSGEEEATERTQNAEAID